MVTELMPSLMASPNRRTSDEAAVKTTPHVIPASRTEPIWCSGVSIQVPGAASSRRAQALSLTSPSSRIHPSLVSARATSGQSTDSSPHSLCPAFVTLVYAPPGSSMWPSWIMTVSWS